MTLKHDNQCRLNITNEPAELAMEDHEFQIRFKGETYWRDLGTGTTMNWTTGVAGELELRGRAKNSGKYATVQFPTRSQIIADAGNSGTMEAEWQQTLVDSTPSGYQERSFVVYLNTKSNVYYSGSYDQSGLVPPGTDIYFLQLGLIDPEPLPNAAGARYPVATFHTHTPEEFAPSNYTRATGPLGEDEPTAFSEKTPSFVYDYIESPIFGGFAETNIAMVYPYGPVTKEH